MSVAHLAHAPSGAHESVQERLQQAFNLRMLDIMVTLSADGGSAPSAKDVVRLRSCSEEGGAWLRAIPADPSLTLKSGEFCATLSLREKLNGCVSFVNLTLGASLLRNDLTPD